MATLDQPFCTTERRSLNQPFLSTAEAPRRHTTASAENTYRQSILREVNRTTSPWAFPILSECDTFTHSVLGKALARPPSAPATEEPSHLFFSCYAIGPTIKSSRSTTQPINSSYIGHCDKSVAALAHSEATADEESCTPISTPPDLRTILLNPPQFGWLRQSS